MKLRPSRAWILPLILAIFSVIVVAGSLSLRFLDLDTYKGQIVAQVRSALKRDLRYHSGDFSFRYGPSFTFTDVVIKEKDGVNDFVKADQLTIKIAIIPLLRREVVLSRMQLERPFLELSRDRQGVFNISDLFAQPSTTTPTIGGVQLKKARVRFTDLAVAQTPVVTELADTDLYLSRLVRGKSCDFKLSGSVISGSRKVPVFLAGAAKLPAAGTSWNSCEVSGRVRTGGLDAAHFWPYYNRYLPFKSLAGYFGVDGNFKGRLDSFKSKVELTVDRMDLDYPQIFHARLNPKEIKASCEMELKNDNLHFGDVKLKVDGVHVDGSCRLSGLHSKDMRITAKATTNSFNLRDYRQFIPYGIIVKDTADFIEQKVTGGIYKLDEGRLDGTVSQILHMERGQNYNILFVKAHVDEGVVTYGSGWPVVSAIKGELQLAGKDFILKGMTGKFGTSPMSLEGRITDYPLNVPCRYLFTANVRPRQPEAIWALGRIGQKLTMPEGSTLKVSGEGPTSLYNLSGMWDLGSIAYSIPDFISKPKGRPNTVAFKLSFTKDEYRITGLNYHLAPLSLYANSVSPYDKGPVSFDFRTNQFQVAEVAPLMPALAKYHPSGKVQAQFHASGPDLDRLHWGGNVALSGVSMKACDKIKPLSAVNTNLQINGDTVETSQFSARIGNSPVIGHGTVTGFKKPNVTVSFTSPGLDVGDIGLHDGKVPLRAQKVQGTVSYSNEKDYVQISSLSCTLGKTPLQVKGMIQELQHPKMELTVTSPHLELDDVTPIFAGSGSGSRPTVKVHLSANEGKAFDLPFQRLRGVAMVENSILYFQPLEFGWLDGEVNAKMRIDFTSNVPRYQVSGSMQRVSAERIARALGVKKQEITGSLSLQGDVAAKGENSLELRRSALGAVKLRIERGTIRKFSTLSKIFSILNVSQLFKGQLPDMVSGGMPYNRIAGDFAIKDGVATTQNLFLDSNAMNLSAVGKIDLGREELDLSIGVQPLQTVDKVVSRIPIVGWILTGKDHSFITTYFEARGKVEDPQVKAVPVKSLAKGVLNVFKRVFELPGRLITDTGEVLIGN